MINRFGSSSPVADAGAVRQAGGSFWPVLGMLVLMLSGGLGAFLLLAATNSTATRFPESVAGGGYASRVAGYVSELPDPVCVPGGDDLSCRHLRIRTLRSDKPRVLAALESWARRGGAGYRWHSERGLYFQALAGPDLLSALESLDASTGDEGFTPGYGAVLSRPVGHWRLPERGDLVTGVSLRLEFGYAESWRGRAWDAGVMLLCGTLLAALIWFAYWMTREFGD